MSSLSEILLLSLSMALAPGAAAGDLTISASVDRTQLTLDEQVILTVAVAGPRTNLPEPRLPAMPNFNVHGAGRNQSISFVNGAISSSVEYRYILVPRAAGKALIGPISVSEGGRASETTPIELLVLKHGSAPAPSAPSRPGVPGQVQQAAGGPDLFVTAEVDDPKPFVNQQVLFTVRLYIGVPLAGNAEWSPPATAGFLSEDLPPGQPKQVAQGGRRYQLSEVKLALFPAQSGKLTIGSGAIRCQVQQEFAVDPFSQDFFQRFFSQGIAGGLVAKELKTKPIAIDAAPLPEGKPPSFSGAVGRYRMTAETDKRKVKVGDALNLTLAIEGTGNLKAIAQPPMPDLGASFRLYDTVSSLNLQKDEAGVRGSKVFKTVLVPKVSGPLRVPAIPFSYFDPQSKAYVTVETAPIELAVEPGSAEPPQAQGFAPAAGGGAITQLTDDIRHVKPPRGIPRLSAVATRRLWPHLIPLGAFLASLGVFLRRESLLRDPAGARARKAVSKAGLLIDRARALQAQEPQRAAGLLSEAILGYLADKLDCPASGLTRKQVAQLLLQRYPRFPEGHLERFKMLLDELELQRFAPSAPGAEKDGAHLVEGVRELVKALEEEIKK